MSVCFAVYMNGFCIKCSSSSCVTSCLRKPGNVSNAGSQICFLSAFCRALSLGDFEDDSETTVGENVEIPFVVCLFIFLNQSTQR